MTAFPNIDEKRKRKEDRKAEKGKRDKATKIIKKL